MTEKPQNWPKTVDEAVDILLSEMSDKDKKKLKDMREEDFITLHFTAGMDIRAKFNLWENKDLLQSLIGKNVGYICVHPDDASSIIIKKLWKRLQD